MTEVLLSSFLTSGSTMVGSDLNSPLQALEGGHSAIELTWLSPFSSRAALPWLLSGLVWLSLLCVLL